MKQKQNQNEPTSPTSPTSPLPHNQLPDNPPQSLTPLTPLEQVDKAVAAAKAPQKSTQQVPPHKSEKMFRRYEPHIHTLLNNWPASTCFFPSGFALTTFSCRLRDSINSVLEYNWPTALDLTLLRKIWIDNRNLKWLSKTNQTRRWSRGGLLNALQRRLWMLRQLLTQLNPRPRNFFVRSQTRPGLLSTLLPYSTQKGWSTNHRCCGKQT